MRAPTEDDLRKVQACLAEAGYSPELVWLDNDRGSIVGSPAIPRRVKWRAAWLTAGGEVACCLACYEAAAPGDLNGLTCGHEKTWGTP